MANYVLFQWGPIQFQVYPFNVNQMSHHTAADWAKKEIAGAAMYREWVGENDEQITLKGKVFPHFFARHERNYVNAQGRKAPILDRVETPGAILGSDALLQEYVGDFPSAGGLTHLDVIDNMRRLGQAHILIRGDGWHFGWYIMENLNRGHSLLAVDGIGQMIEFEASFQRVPVPNDPASNIVQMYSSGVIGGGSGGDQPPPPEPQPAQQPLLRDA